MKSCSNERYWNEDMFFIFFPIERKKQNIYDYLGDMSVLIYIYIYIYIYKTETFETPTVFHVSI